MTPLSRRPFTVAVLGALAGCATVPPAGDPASTKDTCRADAGERFVGQRATSESGAALLEASQSTRMRWVPPNTVVTLDYAFGRVTVRYVNAYAITVVSCG
jgi:hypothetical protein